MQVYSLSFPRDIFPLYYSVTRKSHFGLYTYYESHQFSLSSCFVYFMQRCTLHAHWAKCNIIVRLSNIFEGGFFEKNLTPCVSPYRDRWSNRKLAWIRPFLWVFEAFSWKWNFFPTLGKNSPSKNHFNLAPKSDFLKTLSGFLTKSSYEIVKCPKKSGSLPSKSGETSAPLVSSRLNGRRRATLSQNIQKTPQFIT
jgi:hypothetical protein